MKPFTVEVCSYAEAAAFVLAGASLRASGAVAVAISRKGRDTRKGRANLTYGELKARWEWPAP